MPTREKFLNNPRSKEIREICIALLDELEAMHIWQSKPYEQKLIDLGIQKDMNANQEEAKYNDPLFCVEWAAGQILSLCDYINTSDKVNGFVVQQSIEYARSQLK